MNRACAALALVVVVTATGCGGDSEDDPTITAPSTTPSATATSADASPAPTAETGVTLRAGDFSFSPRTVTIRAGQVLSLRNSGRAAHTWTSKPGQKVSFDIALSEPGSTATFSTATVGSYDFVCTIHESRGMTGTLVVTA